MKYHYGKILRPWISPKIEIGGSLINGRGMFAGEYIFKDEIVLIWGGTIVSAKEIEAGKVNRDSVAIIDDDIYLADLSEETDCPDYFLNHSCEPNLWMLDEITLKAIRDIKTGEELTADYAMWEADPDWQLYPCNCGSPECRGIISGKDWRLLKIQNKYRGHFSPYINRLIENLDQY